MDQFLALVQALNSKTEHNSEAESTLLSMLENQPVETMNLVIQATTMPNLDPLLLSHILLYSRFHFPKSAITTSKATEALEHYSPEQIQVFLSHLIMLFNHNNERVAYSASITYGIITKSMLKVNLENQEFIMAHFHELLSNLNTPNVSPTFSSCVALAIKEIISALISCLLLSIFIFSFCDKPLCFAFKSSFAIFFSS